MSDDVLERKSLDMALHLILAHDAALRARIERQSDTIEFQDEELAKADAEVDRLREALEEITDVSMDTLRGDPPRLDEIYKIARQALEAQDDRE